MNIWLVLLILLALGIIVGNLMLLKYSANMKFGKSNKESKSSLDQASKVNKKEP